MAEPQGWTPEPVTPAAPAAASAWTPEVPPPGWTREVAAPDFRTTNERDALGNPTIDPNSLGTAISHLWAQNPIAGAMVIGRAVMPEVVARAVSPGLTDRGAQQFGPLNAIKNIGAAQGAVFDRAVRSYQQGDYLSAARHFVNYLIPVIGPGLDRSSDLFSVGKWVAGGADALGIGLATFGPQAIAEAAAARTAAAQRAGPALPAAQQAASTAFAEAEGIPLSAGVASGNPAVAGLEAVAAHTLGGSLPMGRFKAAQAAALTRVGRQLASDVHPQPMTAETAGLAVRERLAAATQAEDAARAGESAALTQDVHPQPMTPETAGAAAQARIGAATQAFDAARTAEGQTLAEQVHPQPMTPETAGAATQAGMQGAVRTLHDAATAQYDALRAIEADPTHTERVMTAPPGSSAFRSILGKLTTGVESAAGDTNPEIQTWAQTVGGRGPTAPELLVMRQMEAELDAQPYTPYLLQPGKYGSSLEHVEGTGGAGAPVYHEILQAAPGTADLTRGDVQAAITKTLETGEWNNASRGAFKVAQDRLRSSGSLNGPPLDPGAPLLGGTRDVALPVNLATDKQMLQPLYDRLLRESQLVPLQGDKARALTALDRLMRGPDVESVSIVDAALGDLKAMARSEIPDVRTAGQGVAATVVKRLSAAVDRAVAKAGPDAVNALEAGRQATVAKYGAADLVKALPDEPVGTFRKLTQPQDASVGLLRGVSDYAPGTMPALGRGMLEQWADLTPEARLKAWQALGPETKTRLFGNDAQVARLEDWLTRSTQNQAGGVLQQLGDEPVGAFRKLTQPHDANVEFLRSFAKQAPDSLSELGRAKLTEWADLTPEARLKAWQALGPETKTRLFGNDAQVARVDNVFTRATQPDAGAILRRLREEPVGSYRLLTADHDAGIAFLRDVQRHAPESLPEVGRAQMEEWLARATKEGRFDHGDALYAEWQKLGPNTKRALFGGPLQVQRLDQFFTLAKRIAKNPNPSGSGYTASLAAQAAAIIPSPLLSLYTQAGGYALAKFLTTPQGVSLVNRALALSMKAPTGSGAAAAQAAWATVANAARATPAAAAGPWALPHAADRETAAPK
jgi:hypothetical protein